MTKQEYNKQYRLKSKAQLNAWLTKTYGRMKRDNKKKFNSELPFTKEMFATWVIQFNIYDLLTNYEISGFDKNVNPSINRLNDYQGYTFENMELITWAENNLKGRMGIKNKQQCSDMAIRTWSKKVIQRDINGNILNEFTSTHDVERHLGIDSSLIARACRKNKIAKGYRWEYAQSM